MAMTPAEMVVYFGSRLESIGNGMQVAQSSSNYHRAKSLCRQAFKCRLMQGLISWRLGNDPSEFISNGVIEFGENWPIVQSIGGDNAQLQDVPVDWVGFATSLVGHPWSIEFSGDGLTADRLLNWVLVTWLFGSWNDALWDQGMAETQKRGSRLAVDTYNLYRTITTAPTSDLPELLQQGEKLFRKRKQDSFFSGGDGPSGGGPDNDVTVDFRLAALLKHRGYEGDSMHVWRW